jgi:hypothetical protein
MPLKASQNRATAHGLVSQAKQKAPREPVTAYGLKIFARAAVRYRPEAPQKRNDMPEQLDLFGWKPPQQEQPTVKTANTEGLPAYDPNAFHHIYEIKKNGEREWVDSYNSEFCVKYAMEIFYCNLKHKSSFDLQNIREANKAVKISESMRSVILELDGHLYICSCKPGTTVIEGKDGSRFDYQPFRPHGHKEDLYLIK